MLGLIRDIKQHYKRTRVRWVECWTATVYLQAKNEGSYFVFPTGEKILLDDWRPTENILHWRMVQRQMQMLFPELLREEPEKALRELYDIYGKFTN